MYDFRKTWKDSRFIHTYIFFIYTLHGQMLMFLLRASSTRLVPTELRSTLKVPIAGFLGITRVAMTLH